MFDYNQSDVEFKAWPKTPRKRDGIITISEKIDGTNACVIVRDGEVVGMQSRNRLIAPGDDNYGFAFWAFENREDLIKLGDDYHYGEWAGPGIQGNPHKLTKKAFFLFNTYRPADTLPECVKQVRVLYTGPRIEAIVDTCMDQLQADAAKAGYQPEGVIIYDHDTRTYAKDTFQNRKGKWAS